jgi:hypothetical protein
MPFLEEKKAEDHIQQEILKKCKRLINGIINDPINIEI